MRKIQCESCKRSIPVTSDLLAAAAMDMESRFQCQCGATLEVAYIDNRLVSANVGRMITFRAAGSLQIENSTRLEAR